MNIEQLKAARDAVAACIEMSDNTSVPENERVVWSQGTTAKPFIHIGMLKMILPFLDQAIENYELLKQADKFFDSINEQFPDALENGRKQLAEIADRSKAINAPDLLEVLKEANVELNRRNSYDVQYKTTSVLVNVQKAIKDYEETK